MSAGAYERIDISTIIFYTGDSVQELSIINPPKHPIRSVFNFMSFISLSLTQDSFFI